MLERCRASATAASPASSLRCGAPERSEGREASRATGTKELNSEPAKNSIPERTEPAEPKRSERPAADALCNSNFQFGLLNQLGKMAFFDWSFDWNWSEKQCTERTYLDVKV